MNHRLRCLQLAFAGVAGIAVASGCHHDSTPTAPTSSGLFMSVDSGFNGQNAKVLDTIKLSVHVRKTADSSAVPNQVVTWSITTGSGTLGSPTTTTDASGRATNTWVLDSLAGAKTIVASVTGASVSISANAIATAAAKLVKAVPDSQSFVSTATTPLIVRASDKFGNGVPGVVVTWSASGGVLSASTTTTGGAGNATVNFTVPAKGTYTVTATAPGFAPVTFTVFGT